MARVIWVIDDPERAKELHRYLHFNYPGGNQDMTDQLATAIVEAEAPLEKSRIDGMNRGDLYLQQMRTVHAELQASLDEEDGHEGIHYQHLAATWEELDRVIAAGSLPSEWKQQYIDASQQ